MTSYEFDLRQVEELAADLARTPERVSRDVRAIMQKGALNIKKDMQAEIGRSPHFGGVARDITYETIETRDGVEAEIGAEVGRGKGHQGGLAWIAAFGTSTTAPSWDHTAAARRELPTLEKYLNQAVGKIL